MHLALTFTIFGLLTSTVVAQDHSPASQRHGAEYTKWVNQYAGTPFKAFSQAYPNQQVWLTLLSIECEGDAQSPQAACQLPTNKAQVSLSGLVASRHTTCCPGVGGSDDKLTAENFEQLKTLAAELPDDGSRLPPSGERLLLQVLDQGKIKVRVYDEENLPGTIQKIIDLIGLRILHQHRQAGQ